MKKTPILLAGVGLLTLPAVAALAPGGTAYTKRASTALLAQPSAMADTVIPPKSRTVPMMRPQLPGSSSSA